MVPMTTTPMLEAWTQKPHSNEIPPPNVASRIISPIHVSDQAATAAAMLAALGRRPPGRAASPCALSPAARGRRGPVPLDRRVPPHPHPPGLGRPLRQGLDRRADGPRPPAVRAGDLRRGTRGGDGQAGPRGGARVPGGGGG